MSKKKKTSKNKYSKAKSRIKLGFKLAIIGTLLVCLFVLIKYGMMMVEYQAYASDLVSDRTMFKQNLTTIVYDSDGEIIANLCTEKDSYYLENDEIPYLIKRAFITTEDRSFYEHSGLDYKAILRAFIALIENEGEITQGGSTITQQLARNIFLSHEVSMERKVKEMFIASELEDTYSKDEILEFYINNIYFGNGFYGIEAASMGYFNKTITELTSSQMIFLCAIPNSPSKYDPFTNIDSTLGRRDLIAKILYDEGELDLTLYNEIITEPIILSPSEDIKHNYVETFMRYCATKELMKNRGFTFQYSFTSDEEEEAYNTLYNQEYSYCNSLLFTGGYRIYTTIDMTLQEELQNTVNSVTAANTETNDEGTYTFQSSATTIDNLTGFVIAIVGGREQEQNGYTLNRAFQSYRQPGSSIKPLIVYTPAFERGYTPDTIVIDEKINGGPANADRYYAGEITIRTAVEKSKNTIAWKLFNEIGVHTCLRYLIEMDFHNIVKTDYVPAASIGGFTYGMSTYEMASGYATLSNDGVYRNPTCILKITDDDGNIIVDNTGNSVDNRTIYEENAANTMTNVLKGVLERGTGRKYQVDNAICAAKTGTTNNNYDSWFVGYSYYYTTAVWCGYDLPKEMNENSEVSCAAHIWHNYMTYLHNDLAPMDIGMYVDTPGIEDETTTAEPKTDEYGNIIEHDTDEHGNLIEDITDENGNYIESITDIHGNLIETPSSAEGSSDETSSSNTGSFYPDEETTPASGDGSEIETGIYIPDDIQSGSYEEPTSESDTTIEP